jgi:16S rRNA G527 N7-methylase RsmG
MVAQPADSAGPEERSGPEEQSGSETPAERRRRRAAFLRELTEARELQARVHPRRTKTQQMRQAVRMRTFRI